MYEVQLQTDAGRRRAPRLRVQRAGGAKAIWRRCAAKTSTGNWPASSIQLHDAADMAVDEQHLAGFQMGDALLGVLIVRAAWASNCWRTLASYHIRAAARAERDDTSVDRLLAKYMLSPSVNSMLAQATDGAAGRVVYELVAAPRL